MHEAPRGYRGIPPRKIYTLRLNLVQIAMLRTGSGKPAIKEISPAIHARVANSEMIKRLLDPPEICPWCIVFLLLH